ncbi:Uncharacterized protein DAT39_011751 [Clarias magur]|uniref:Uncharacterized protein n=1 Tax=Clarias magur TaxID=1594786 RepID=A0A8J4UFP8_CLAMG|nr:Uncharacterized protein DAT39_011751 [Clarias magur]
MGVVLPQFCLCMTPGVTSKGSSWEFHRGATALQFWCTRFHLLTLCKQMLGFVLKESPLAFGYTPKGTQLELVAKKLSPMTTEDFERVIELQTRG